MIQVLRLGYERRTLPIKDSEGLYHELIQPGRDDPTGPHEPAAPAGNPPGGADAYANWLDRMQRARARQAAITRNLYTWSNYKSWADQVRDSWQSDTATKTTGSPGKPTKK